MKKFSYDNPKNGDEFYFVSDGDVRWDIFCDLYSDMRALVKNHNFFRTYEVACKACKKMKELFKKIQEEEKRKEARNG